MPFSSLLPKKCYLLTLSCSEYLLRLTSSSSFPVSPTLDRLSLSLISNSPSSPQSQGKRLKQKKRGWKWDQDSCQEGLFLLDMALNLVMSLCLLPLFFSFTLSILPSFKPLLEMCPLCVCLSLSTSSAWNVDVTTKIDIACILSLPLLPNSLFFLVMFVTRVQSCLSWRKSREIPFRSCLTLSSVLRLKVKVSRKVFWCLSCVSFGSICSVQSLFLRPEGLYALCLLTQHSRDTHILDFLFPSTNFLCIYCDFLFWSYICFLEFGILWTCSAQYLPFEFALEWEL